jgi:hypothetical protein
MLVAFGWELTEETMDMPLHLLQAYAVIHGRLTHLGVSRFMSDTSYNVVSRFDVSLPIKEIGPGHHTIQIRYGPES